MERSMTPQERERVNALFDRLSSVENQPRDTEAERLIADGLSRAPHAIYALVQTVLLQDDALREADARIRSLQENAPANAPQGSFLDSMRGALFGRPAEQRGSVPTVRPEQTGPSVSPAWGGGYQGQPMPQAMPQPASGGGSFLSTAAASAAGVIGGALLLDSIRSMMAPRHAAFTDSGGVTNSPWQGNATNSDLARQAGIDDIGRGGQQVGLLDNSDSDNDGDDDDGDFADSGPDDGDSSDDSDFA
jgi:hypothetical protein